MATERIRTATPGDYDKIVSVLNAWWGREMRAGLPRLFLDHFYETSLVAEESGEMLGFLIGFHSPSKPREAYIAWVGVDPLHRKAGLARRLYDCFAGGARSAGCTVLCAITSPVNGASVAFHRRMGFEVSAPVADYNGPGRDMIVFTRTIAD